MNQPEFHYLVHLQFLGFRFHGWAKQTGLKTVHGMFDKTTSFVLGHERFKTMGCSRTDSKVSALDYLVQLIIREDRSPDRLLEDYNFHLPPDIRATRVVRRPEGFNILQSPLGKTYIYLFACGEKPHPLAAPFLACFPETLDLKGMGEAAVLFEGRHNLRNYCSHPTDGKTYQRTISHSRITPNEVLTASFFPANTYVYRITSKGFLRNQVRLIMGKLLEVGRGRLDANAIADSLDGTASLPPTGIAPASGLLLESMHLP